MNGNITDTTKKRHFYGWQALCGASLVYFTECGITYYAYGVLLPAMCGEYGWSRAAVGAGLSVCVLSYGLPSPLIGISIARFGPRANVICGSLLVILGLVAMSTMRAIWQLYLFYGIMVGLGGGFAGYIASTTVVNNWFIRKRSLAMGLLMSAGGVAGFFFPLLTTGLISTIGLQMTWPVLAMTQLVCGLLIGGVVLIRDGPENLGQTPDGVLSLHASEVKEHATHRSRIYQSPVEWQFKEALRPPTTWLIAAVCSANSFSVVTVTSHQVAYLTDIGFSPLVAAITLGMIPAASTVGQLGFGMLGTRFEVGSLAIAGCLLQVIALLILSTAKTLFLIYAYAVLFGISYGGLIVALPLYVGAYYGRTHYAQILGLVLSLTFVADATGPIMAGAIHDTLGTYIPAFLIITAFSMVGLICAILARPPSRSH